MVKQKITFLAVGSRGDLNPACALGGKLLSLGYKVCIATHDNFKSYVESKNLEFAPIAGNFKELLSSEAGLQFLEGKKQKFRIVNDELYYQQLKDAYAAAINSDALIIFPLSLFGYHIAEKLNIPYIFSSFVPLTSTREFPFLRFDLQNRYWFLSFLNRFSYDVAGFISWQTNRTLINKFRKEVLGLNPVGFFGVEFRRNAPKNFKWENIPILYQYSSRVIPTPQDWSQKNIYVTGNWFLAEEDDFSPSTELLKFLNEGSKPIYIGFGSMTLRNPRHIFELIVNAIKETKQRAIIAASWSGMGEFVSDNKNIYVANEYIPYSWLFEKMRILIHHGGSGTTALALKSGVPQIVIPFTTDQPVWARKMVNLGVASEFISIHDLNQDNLKEAIFSTLNNDDLKPNAESIGASIREEKGVELAAKLVTKLIGDFYEN